jgi:hypothetical protein
MISTGMAPVNTFPFQAKRPGNRVGRHGLIAAQFPRRADSSVTPV